MEAPVDRGHSLIYIGSGSLDAWNNAVLRDSGSEWQEKKKVSQDGWC